MRDYIGVSYDGVAFDVCGTVQNYDFLAVCAKEGTEFAIVREKLPGQTTNLLNAWQDITSKLRPETVT